MTSRMIRYQTASSKRTTLIAYHYAIRNVKRNEDAIFRERIADAVLDNKGRNFWAEEVKRLRSNKASNCRIVDGMTDAGSIAKIFADKYRDLYTSAPYNVCEMRCIVDRVNCL